MSPMSCSSAQTTYSSSSPGPVGAGRGLQGVRQAVDREAAVVAVEQLQVGEDRGPAAPGRGPTKLVPMIAQSSAVDSSMAVKAARTPVSTKAS